jgi:hypothetical protein
MVTAAALAHLYKDQGTPGVTHDEVNFTAAAPRRSIIARQQTQALALQMRQGQCLSGIALLFGADPLWIEIAH